MIRQQSGNSNNRMENWLAYTPLLYKSLILNRVPQLSSINSVRWIRGVVDHKPPAQFQRGTACLAGSTSRRSKTGGFQGGLCTFNCMVTVADQMDDDRLSPYLTLRSFWSFKEQIGIVQQYANYLVDKQKNNMLAISYSKFPIVNVISTKKVLQKAEHAGYAQEQCIKLQGHTQPITSIVWANYSSGNKILTSSQDSTIMEWDVQKITLDRHLKYHRGSVNGLCPLYNYSPPWNEGKVVHNQMYSIASVSNDGNIFIWESRSAIPVIKINSKSKQLTAVDCLSHQCIITGGTDGSIKLWDLRNNRDYLYENKLDRLEGHQGRVKQIKVKRNSQSKKSQPNEKNKNTWLGDIKFSSSGQDGKIINWQQKLQFAHLGHQNHASFDLSDQYSLCVSAEANKNVFMIWQPGASIGKEN